MMDQLRQDCLGLAPAEIIKKIIGKTGYKQFLLDGSLEGESRWENIQELIGVAETQANLAEFLEQVALIQDTDVTTGNGDIEGSVTLMTAHSAKGLEFPVVFVTGMEEGIFPHSRSFTDKGNMEEERRLAYVAMTRAKDRLYLLYACERQLYGLSQYNDPSRFIKEIPEELREKI